MIKTDQDPYEISQQILNKKFKCKVSCGYLTLEVRQELENNKHLSLKEAMANMGMGIVETPVDFETETFTTEQIESIMNYCENDVCATAKIFEQREQYFMTKFEIVEAYRLHPTDVKETMAKLASKVLKARKMEHTRDRLKLVYDKRIPISELPKSVVDFYNIIVASYLEGGIVIDLEKRKFEYKIAGLTHTYGFGVLHAARENYVGEEKFLHIDGRSFFPTIKLNNNFISRAATMPER